jgi:glycosyltransferase involved in cell wall biosynthesis
VSGYDGTRWICCQLGAREHFAVARGLHRRRSLTRLITDAWAPPGSPWAMVPGQAGRRLAERYSVELASAAVRSFTPSLIGHEAWWRLRRVSGWPLVIERNRWFQARASSEIRSATVAQPTAVFAHSYAALEVFRAAKSAGMTTVLGQIDPGDTHMRVLREVAGRWPEFGPPLEEPPAAYFDDWREECRLADRIVANSEWSRDLLEQSGIDGAKIEVVPLPFEPEPGSVKFERAYPAAFTATRPLRVLFAGSIAVFKGVPSLLESLALLRNAPIELRMVGAMASTIPRTYLDDARIRWVGPVSRSEVMAHCRQADVLVFPSHSDGFGMAQVEAQAWRLPIIASPSCGRVVRDGVNGIVLPEVSAAAIAEALSRALDPSLLRTWSAAPVRDRSVDAFGDAIAKSMASKT